MQLKILKDIPYLNKIYRSGTKVTIKDDGNNIPLDSFWRNRLKDAPLDGCVEIVIKKVKKIKKEVE